MRIALNGRFYAAPVTGVQRFAVEVAQRLAAHTEVLLMLPRGVPAPDLDGVTVVTGRLRGHAWEQTEFPWRARAAGCDVCLNLSGTLPAIGGPHVAVVHDVLPLTHPEWFSPAFAAWYRLAVGRNARRAARVVTVSRWSAEQIVRVLGIDPDHIVISTQGLTPFDAPASNTAVARVRRLYDLPARYILGVGHGDPRKNVPFLIEVMREWRRRDADAPGLVLVGQTSARVHGRMLAETSSEGVYVLGRVEDDQLQALYTGASAFAFPSLAEGFGRPPLEALACGAPAVVAPYGTAAEVLRDGAAIVPLDIDAWIAQLHAMVVEGQERSSWIARGRMIARACNWDDAAAQVLGACEDAAGRAPAALGV